MKIASNSLYTSFNIQKETARLHNSEKIKEKLTKILIKF